MDVTDDDSMVSGVKRDRRRARAARRTRQQRRLRVLRRRGGRADRRGASPVRGQRFGLARLTQLVTPTCGSRGAAGSSTSPRSAAKFYEPLGAWYHATKFAVEGFSDSLRIELAPFGIDVVIIEPGPIRTEWNEISRESLTETSRGGAFEEMAGNVRQVLERADTSKLMSSPPDVVAMKIVKAATASNPRARYPVGRNAGTILRARRLLPDRASTRS
ncbi:SDR family NAD(P)-dependent oxidoreductase [Nocardioides ungokensis]|uniref:SDR family NAD(P)-dependent oxidoreductase n=1 Tax=Nocardioides ungokensis TaxID=1643322 RepID=UPI001C6099CE|nr:SDR family NAD(P)-dependent oxidoreductase [Nocardioides ungokensis]